MTNFDFYISLTSYGEENLNHARVWFQTVYGALPRGTVASIDNPEDPSSPIRLVRTKLHGCVKFTVPLSRDLSPYELNEIKNKWATSGIVGNFAITSSSTISEKLKIAADNLVLNDADYDSLCYQLVKAEHQRWYAEKAADGWTYGPIMSVFNKTHPLMRQWEDLPDEYKKIDRDHPHRLLDMLASHGYSVVKRSELDALISLMHSVKIPV